MSSLYYRVITVADIEVSEGSEFRWEGTEEAERSIEGEYSRLLLQLSGDGCIIIHDVAVIPLPELT
jgi:hypothetical protein